jgi:two-component system, cell cycle sensor histidine kinase and response regulator CckA
MMGNTRAETTRHWAIRAATWLGVAGGYFVLAQLSFRSASVHPVVAAVWPPAGLALGLLVLQGRGVWPGIFVGVLLANAARGLPWAATSVIAVGNTLAAVAAARLLTRFGFEKQLHRVRDALLLLAAAVLCPLIAAFIGTGSLYFAAGAELSLLMPIGLTWWSGDALGVMLMAPLLLAWSTGRLPHLDTRRLIEAALLGIGLITMSVMLMRSAQHGFEYAVLPFVGWAAIRGGPRGASLAAVAAAVIAMWFAGAATGPFTVMGHHGLLQLQVFLALLTTKSVVLGAVSAAQLRAVEALVVYERRFRQIFDHSAVGIAVVHSDGGITEANPAFRKMMGYSSAELSVRNVADITHPEDMAAEQELLEQMLAGERTTYRMTKRYRRKDGSIFWGRLTATHVPEGIHGLDSAGVGMVEDISEQRAAEEALERDAAERRESAEQLQRTTQTLQTLIDASPLAIMTLDSSGRLRTWNHAAEGMFGWSADEAIGRVVPFVPPEGMKPFRESLQRVFAGEALTGLQAERCRRDGKRIDVRICAAPTRDSNGTIDGAIALVEDVTERKNLGEQLRQAQKMEAIGQLTGGIAHDFNNLLTIVITNAALLASEIAPDQADMRAELSELQRAALRGVELVRKLMAFSRRRSVELQAIDLGQVVSDASNDLRRLLPASVEVTVQAEKGVSLIITGDIGAIEQILFNLATNARDAMPDGGALRLSVHRAWLDEEHRRTRGWGSPGEYIVIAVGDTGCGMSPSVQARAFEPFFTTKEVGKGTGLGMAMVYGLVTQHRGYADIYSEEGRGTTVRLYFPAVATAVGKGVAPQDDVSPVGGSERILVVDDEDGIRRSAVRVLSRFGYEVDEAPDGCAAMGVIREAKSPFNLVLTDVVMPRMGGMALYHELRREGSAVPVLLMSGHTAEDLDQLEDPVAGAGFLHKPWSVTDLLRRVREVLDAGSGAAA